MICLGWSCVCAGVGVQHGNITIKNNFSTASFSTFKLMFKNH